MRLKVRLKVSCGWAKDGLRMALVVLAEKCESLPRYYITALPPGPSLASLVVGKWWL